MQRIPIGVDVLTATRQRIEWVFDTFKRVYVSFSGGKDSTAMLHIVVDEAKKRGVKVGVLFIDWECQFEATIDHVRHVLATYKDSEINFKPIETLDLIQRILSEFLTSIEN